MSQITITKKTAAQIDADFTTVFKDIEPAKPTKPLTQADRLAPYRKAILKQRRRGLTWKQIADGMAQPPIEEKVSERLLCEIFKEAGAATKPANSATRKPDVTAATSATEAPAPQPMTPKEHEQYDGLLQGLIPPIVNTKMNRADARSYASNAFERLRANEAERAQELLAAELDALNETNCARYGLAPESIAPWKRRWK